MKDSPRITVLRDSKKGNVRAASLELSPFVKLTCHYLSWNTENLYERAIALNTFDTIPRLFTSQCI
jgi:hypothetical protein